MLLQTQTVHLRVRLYSLRDPPIQGFLYIAHGRRGVIGNPRGGCGVCALSAGLRGDGTFRKTVGKLNASPGRCSMDQERPQVRKPRKSIASDTSRVVPLSVVCTKSLETAARCIIPCLALPKTDHCSVLELLAVEKNRPARIRCTRNSRPRAVHPDRKQPESEITPRLQCHGSPKRAFFTDENSGILHGGSTHMSFSTRCLHT